MYISTIYRASLFCMCCPLKDNGGPLVYKKVILICLMKGGVHGFLFIIIIIF